MPDLRLVFRNLMKKWGSNVYLHRKDYSIKGEGPYKDEPNHGFTSAIEKWTVRMSLPGRGSTRLSMGRSEQSEGIVTNVDLIFYFPWDAGPKEQDRIYVPDPRYDVPLNTDDYHGHELYVVDYAMPMKGLGGRIEFFEVGATRESPS